MNLTQCELAYDYNANVWIVLILSIVAALNLVGILLTLHVTRILLSTQVFHINLRILFGNLSFCLCLRSGLTLYRAVEHLFLVATWKSKCDFLKSAKSCILQSSLNAAPVFVLVFAYLMIALERCIATLMYKTYERRKDVGLSLLVAFLSWVHPVTKLVFSITSDVVVDDKPYCSSMTAKEFSFAETFIVPLIVLILSSVLFGIVWRFCHLKQKLTLSTQQHNLSGRFQLGENIRASKIVLPNAFLFVLVTVINIIVITAMKLIPGLDKDMRLFGILKEASSLTFPIYINLYALVFILHCSSVAKRTWIIRRYDRFTKDTWQEEEQCANNHFNLLTSYWK
ncbi:hypothetical protein QR680_000708 [Steinernema hermaphroditum]|uniref:G-protein coupled receptors family 1 profile domain-containing protein n=1 Tax=Steinernema hermaphroditum TaxID=289476 RepID=A0AA39GYD2_9BILA|nr:hypothetical protein QR680_000708 [Steinernema hermaphroditum]